jgi:hypothetical protein
MCASSLSAAEEALTIFKAGDKVKAAEINANFELLRAAAADAVSFEGLDDVYGGLFLRPRRLPVLNLGFLLNRL